MKKILFSISLLALSIFQLEAQPINSASASQKYEIALEEYERGNWESARIYLQDYYKENKDELDIPFKIAESQFYIGNYEDADKWFERAFKKDKRGQYGSYNFLYGMTKKHLGQNKEAALAFKEYIGAADDPALAERARLEISGMELATRMEPNPKVVIELATGQMNKKTRELSPRRVGLDEMYYASHNRNSKVVLDGDDKDPYLKVMYAKKESDGWGKGKKVTKKVNREGFNTKDPFISLDGKRMYYVRLIMDEWSYEEVIETQLYMSYKDDDKWGPAKRVKGIGEGYAIHHPVLGELFGDEVMLFASDMDGGYGGMDIYYAKRIDDDQFENPVNLGQMINTSGDDVTPWYVDGKLYYSSDGWPTIGGLDIHVSEWNGSSWSKAENVGKDLNSSFDDWYFTIDEEGTYGAMASNRDGGSSMRGPNCCDDIWTVFIDNIVLDLDVRVVADGKPKEADIRLIRMNNNQYGQTEKAKTSSKNWKINRDQSYLIIAEAPGFIADTIDFTTAGINKTTTIEHTLMLKKAPEPKPEDIEPEYETYTTEEAIRLNNIYYDFDDDQILRDAEGDLNLIKDLMNQYPDMVIELSSHTDAQGNDAYNKNLSQRRAESARTWLIDEGITDSRIKAVGYGEKMILNRCKNNVKCSDDEHRFNRRTEFKIISGPTSIKIEKKRLRSLQKKN